MAKHAQQNAGKTQTMPRVDTIDSSTVNDHYPVGMPMKEEKNHKKTAAIVIGVVLGILLLVYLAGGLAFNYMFMPNSKISSLDVSLKTTEAVKSDLDSNFHNFSVKVTGSDLDFTVDSKNANVKVDVQKIVDEAIASVNSWAWPVEIFKMRDFTDVVSSNLDGGDLGTLVKENVDAANENKTDSVDAHLQWDDASSSFVVASEVYGTKIDAEAVDKAISNAIISMQSKVSIGADQYIKPNILKSDPRFESALKKANELGKASFKIMMGDVDAATVDGKTISDWLVVDEDFNVTLDSDAVSKWANEIAEGCNTVGSERTYVRPAGNKEVTVSGGTYGWKADGSGLADQIVEAINAGSSENISVNVTQTANALVPKGQADWGGRWIDVDLTEQHAYMYDNGELVWETDVVTGNPNIGDATPTGVWMINNKRQHETLKGPVKDGKPEWESKVDYWMPFIGNSHGLHDASWQSTFGGSAYQNLNWSHGCINLPPAKATELWNLCKVGDPVVIHY